MSKKRTSLDAIMTKTVEDVAPPAPFAPTVREISAAAATGAKKKPSVYLTPPVHEQLRTLAFQERKNMHDYLLEGLDLVFRQKGLPSIAELNAKGEA